MPKVHFLGPENHVRVSSVTGQSLLPATDILSLESIEAHPLPRGDTNALSPGAERVEPREKGGSARLHLMLLKGARIVSTIPNGAMSFYRPSPCCRHPPRNHGYLREVISKQVSSMSFQGSRLCPGIRKARESSKRR